MMSAPMKKVRVLATACHLCRTYRHRRFYCTNETELKGVVGLEIHAQIQTDSKLFSRANTRYGGATNNQVSLFDAAFPGTLPALNRGCVEAGIKTALALGCHINKVSRFDRKHYFYADLPAGYQITQLRQPLAKGGSLTFPLEPGTTPKNKMPKMITVRLEQIQLEQDSGKSLHDEIDRTSLIDLNRAGVGLMEIITAPDMSNGLEASTFVKEVANILTTIKTCNCKMEEGSLRVDANISVHKSGEPLGTRVEVKNINSFSSVSAAIDHEIKRQKRMLVNGEKVTSGTRSFDVTSGKTVPMRDKEIEMDYRFMPEPNLPPLRVYDNTSLPEDLPSSQIINIDTLRQELPILPLDRQQFIMDTYALPYTISYRIVAIPGAYEFLKEVLDEKEHRNPRKVAVLILTDLLHFMNKEEMMFDELPLTPSKFGELYDMLYEKITIDVFITVLAEMMKTPDISPEEYVHDNNLLILKTDEDLKYLEEICQQVIAQESEKTVKRKRKNTISHLTNKVHSTIQGRASKHIITDILDRLVD